jgi:hypothetical protein
MTQLTSLSGNDAAVLGALFDPEASLSNSTNVEDSLPEGFSDTELRLIQQQEKGALWPLNKDNPTKIDILSAIQNLDQLVVKHPMYASGWNNRGQARRMLFNLGPIHSQLDLLRQIVEDLDRAIAIAGRKSPVASVPALNAKVLASAHTHRGLLFWAASRSDDLRAALTSSIDRLAGYDAERLEELASLEFAAGGRYGNETARQLAVKLNPYAKLCGSIVKEAMQKEISDYYQIPITRTD